MSKKKFVDFLMNMSKEKRREWLIENSTPQQICDAALFAKGAPEEFIKNIKDDMFKNAIVHHFIMNDMSWDNALIAAERDVQYLRAQQTKQ